MSDSYFRNILLNKVNFHQLRCLRKFDKYKNYYPAHLFDTKEAGSYVDINLIKKTAICALGDVSGSGVRLRSDKNINSNVLDYLLTPDSEAFLAMRKWREILDKNYYYKN